MTKVPVFEYLKISSEELKKFHFDRNIEASKSIIRMIIGMCSLWVLILFYYHVFETMILTSIFIVVYSVSYYLHIKGQHLFARILFFTASNAFLFLTILIVGTSMKVDLIMISSVGLIFLVFNYADDKIWILYCFILTMINVFTQ